MCLYVDHTTSINKFNSLEGKETVTFYKSFDGIYRKGKLFLKHYYRNSKFEYDGPGIYYEDKPITREEALNSITVGEGAIHAHSDRKKLFLSNIDRGCAKESYRYTNCRVHNLPIKVKVKDILVFGLSKDVAITSFEITEKTWNSLVTQIKG